MKNIPSIQQSPAQPQKLAALRQAHQDWNNTPDVLTRLTRRLSTTLSLEQQLAILAEELVAIVPLPRLTIDTGSVNRISSTPPAWAAPTVVNIA